MVTIRLPSWGRTVITSGSFCLCSASSTWGRMETHCVESPGHRVLFTLCSWMTTMEIISTIVIDVAFFLLPFETCPGPAACTSKFLDSQILTTALSNGYHYYPYIFHIQRNHSSGRFSNGTKVLQKALRWHVEWNPGASLPHSLQVSKASSFLFKTVYVST